MNATPFIIERTFNALIAKVWKAITYKDEMKQWYFDLAEFKTEPGFEFSFLAGEDGKQYLHLCKTVIGCANRNSTCSFHFLQHR